MVITVDIMVPVTTGPTVMATDTGTGPIGGAGTTEDITVAGTTDVDFTVGDITVAGTPVDITAATAIDPQPRIFRAVLPVEIPSSSLAD
jgi:hypothetical protein